MPSPNFEIKISPRKNNIFSSGFIFFTSAYVPLEIDQESEIFCIGRFGAKTHTSLEFFISELTRPFADVRVPW